jgi:hypothetical protein
VAAVVVTAQESIERFDPLAHPAVAASLVD